MDASRADVHYDRRQLRSRWRKKRGRRLKRRESDNRWKSREIIRLLVKKSFLHFPHFTPTICEIADKLFGRYLSLYSKITRALSVPDRPTSRGEPINGLVASICQVVAPAPRSLNDRFQFLSTAFRASVAHLESSAELNSNSDRLSPKGEKRRRADGEAAKSQPPAEVYQPSSMHSH